MQTSDSPFITDWFVVSIRWLFLLGLVISLSFNGNLLSTPNLILAGLALWNIIMTLLTGLNRRLVFHRQISLGIDLILAGAYFVMTGGYSTPAFWIVSLPLVSAALYFEILGAFIAAVLMTVVQVAYTVYHPLSPDVVIILVVSSIVTFIISAVFGYVGVLLIRTIRKNRQAVIEAQQKKLGMENERLRAVYSLTSTLLATLNYQRVLESLLDLSLSAINAEDSSTADDRLVCAVLLFSKTGSLEVGSARRLTTADMRVVLDGEEGAVAEAIEQNKPILLEDVSRDRELNHFTAFQRCKEVYCFPLRSGFSAYGVLLFGHPQPGFFTQDRREILTILGGQAVIAIQNARLYQDVVDEREHMVEAQEEARKKLARDLHDGPTQSVSAIAMRVNLAQRILQKDPQAAGEELVRIEDLARRTSKEIRHMLFTLRPLVLESQGLVAALESIAQKMIETYSQNVIISVDEDVLKNLEVGKQGVIFFIVEEAVNNARKHAKAEHIWVNLRPFEQEIALLEVRDDGVGFDVASVNRTYDQRGSLGMVNLRERTELVNGVLDVQSSPGRGTHIQVYIPLTEEAADRLHHASGVHQP
jgi:signal transduction histidine kinase